MLGSAAFKKMRWTSLQSNVFRYFALGPGVQLVKESPDTGKQGQRATLLDEQLLLGMWIRIRWYSCQRICFLEIQASKANLVVNGLRDINGPMFVSLVEAELGSSNQ
jgi:hypothetical protein